MGIVVEEYTLNNYSIDYDSSSLNSYLVLRSKEELCYQRYQIEMIAGNSIPGMLPLDVRQINNVTS